MPLPNKYLILFLLCVTSLVSNAAVYQQVDKNGNIVYSDIPLNSSAKLVTPPITNEITIPQSISGVPTSSTKVKKSYTESYTTFAISSPRDEETIQNQPTIPVEINIDPDLKDGDKIQLLLDGNAFGQAESSAHLELSQFERGTHQLSAEIVDSNGNVVKQSNAITIFIHQASTATIRANGANGKPANH